MKTLFTKLQFKLAYWLFNQGIVAPQIMEHTSVIVLPNGHTETDLELYRGKQQEIKNHTNR